MLICVRKTVESLHQTSLILILCRFAFPAKTFLRTGEGFFGAEWLKRLTPPKMI